MRKIKERTGLDNFIFLKLQIESNGHWYIVSVFAQKLEKERKMILKKKKKEEKG